jgi:four helix bundle protein
LQVSGIRYQVSGITGRTREWWGKFEDLDVWKRSARVSADLYKTFATCKDYGFRDQITRSGLSIPSNIAEGFERNSTKESIQFLGYAKGSCGELRTQIYIGMDVGYINKTTGRQWLTETQEISAMLVALIKARHSVISSSG